MSRSSPLARSRVLTGKNVEDARVLLMGQGCAFRRTIEQAFGQAGYRLNVAHEIGGTHAILNCARRGLGIAIVPHSGARRVRDVVTRRVQDVAVRLPIGMVSRVGLVERSRGVAAIMNEIRRALGSASGGPQAHLPQKKRRTNGE